MKTVVIASGHLGSTLKVAEYLKNKIEDVTIFDTNKKCDINFLEFDNFIFGSNIRIFCLNRRYKKWAKKIKKYYQSKKVFVYLVGVDIDNKDKYIEKAKKIIKNACGIYYVWGELNSENAAGFAKNIIESVKADLVLKGKEQPSLLENEIENLAASVKNVKEIL